MKVLWSPLALERVETEALYIARERPAAARRWVEGLFERVADLALFPQSGRVVPELRRRDTREVIYKNYRVI